MTDFNLAEFFALIESLGVEINEISGIELDRYIEAYRKGARDLDTLTALPVFPQTVSIYAHLDYDDLLQVGEQIHLKGDSLRKFTSKAESLELICKVYDDGTIVINQFENQPILIPVVL